MMSDIKVLISTDTVAAAPVEIDAVEDAVMLSLGEKKEVLRERGHVSTSSVDTLETDFSP